MSTNTAIKNRRSTRPSAYYDVAETTLPGAGLGGYSLPEDVRFVIKRGVGSRVESVDGQWYIDYVGGAGANILGHAHPVVLEAVQKQVQQGLHFFGTLTDVAIELSEKLSRADPVRGEDRVYHDRLRSDLLRDAHGARVHRPQQDSEVRGRVPR